MKTSHVLLIPITLLVAACVYDVPPNIALVAGQPVLERAEQDVRAGDVFLATQAPVREEGDPASVDRSQDGERSSSQGCFAPDCHQDMLALSGSVVHPPYAEGVCAPCHDFPASHPEGSGPHVADLRDIEVCAECHPPEILGVSHPVDRGELDPFAGGLLTCTSTCHDPHIAPYKHLLRYPPGGELCIKCHQEFNQP